MSRFLKGEAYDMSDRSKRAIYRWYLTVKKDPSRLSKSTGAVTYIAVKYIQLHKLFLLMLFLIDACTQKYYFRFVVVVFFANTRAEMDYLRFIFLILTAQNPGPFKRQVTMNESGEIVPCKRERFTFRWNHLEVLESYFREDSYPDVAKREQIAEACNLAACRPGMLCTAVCLHFLNLH